MNTSNSKSRPADVTDAAEVGEWSTLVLPALAEKQEGVIGALRRWSVSPSPCASLRLTTRALAITRDGLRVRAVLAAVFERFRTTDPLIAGTLNAGVPYGNFFWKS